MAEIATKPRPVKTKSRPHYVGIPETRFATAVAKTSQLSDGIFRSLETGERAAVAAVSQFVVTIEEALPQEVVDTSTVAKKVTESGFETADRLIHTQYEFLRHVVESAAKSLSSD